MKTGDSGRAERSVVNRDALFPGVHPARAFLFPSVSGPPQRAAKRLNIFHHCTLTGTRSCRNTLASKIILGRDMRVTIPMDVTILVFMWRNIQPRLLEALHPSHPLRRAELPPIRRNQ